MRAIMSIVWIASCLLSRSISAAKNSTNVDEPADLAFDQVMDEMKKDKSRLWNTSELSNTSYLGVKTWHEDPY